MVFVLGIERSATTWVSNILDMHPATELYMEPLSQNISGLDEWPDDRFVRIDKPQEKARYFRDEFLHLKKRKKLLFSRINDTNWAWNADLKIAEKLWRITPIARDFFELNFHRRETTGYPPKEENPLQIIKELRLNFNVPIVKQIDPNAGIIVILRNYAATVQSIENQLQEGNLKELSRLLKEHYGKIDAEAIFDYWSQSYNTLLNDLDNEEMDYLLVDHEDLITSSGDEVENMFDFLGLKPASSVYDYLEVSDKSGSGKHTTDRSHVKILERHRQAERILYPKLANRIAQTNWHPRLQEYVTK